MKLVSYPVTKQDIEQAVAKSEKHGEFNMSVMGKYKAGVTGNLGELIFWRWMNDNFIHCQDIAESKKTDFLITGWSGKKATVEVKLRNRTVPPKKHYNGGTYAYHVDYEVSDYYVFLSGEKLKNEIYPHTIHIVGACSHAQFKAWGEHKRKGQPDGNGFEFKEDSYVISYDRLLSPERVLVAFYEKELNIL